MVHSPGHDVSEVVFGHVEGDEAGTSGLEQPQRRLHRLDPPVGGEVVQVAALEGGVRAVPGKQQGVGTPAAFQRHQHFLPEAHTALPDSRGAPGVARAFPASFLRRAPSAAPALRRCWFRTPRRGIGRRTLRRRAHGRDQSRRWPPGSTPRPTARGPLKWVTTPRIRCVSATSTTSSTAATSPML